MTRPGEEGRTIAPVDDPILIDELLGFRAQFHPSEADGQPMRLVTGRSNVEQTTRNLRAVLWDAGVRIKALAAELAAARAEVDAKVAAARSDALEEAARIADADDGTARGGNVDFGPNVARRIATKIRAARTAEAHHGR